MDALQHRLDRSRKYTRRFSGWFIVIALAGTVSMHTECLAANEQTPATQVDSIVAYRDLQQYFSQAEAGFNDGDYVWRALTSDVETKESAISRLTHLAVATLK